MDLVQCSLFFACCFGIAYHWLSSCVFVSSSASLQLCLFEDARLRYEYSDKTLVLDCACYIFLPRFLYSRLEKWLCDRVERCSGIPEMTL